MHLVEDPRGLEEPDLLDGVNARRGLPRRLAKRVSFPPDQKVDQPLLLARLARHRRVDLPVHDLVDLVDLSTARRAPLRVAPTHEIKDRYVIFFVVARFSGLTDFPFSGLTDITDLTDLPFSGLTDLMDLPFSGLTGLTGLPFSGLTGLTGLTDFERRADIGRIGNCDPDADMTRPGLTTAAFVLRHFSSFFGGGVAFSLGF